MGISFVKIEFLLMAVRAKVNQTDDVNVQLWNVRDRVIEELPRTNNSVEAWHSSFQ